MNPAPRTNLTALCRLIITLLAPVFCPDLGQANSEISFEWVTVGNPGNPNDPLTGVATNGQTPPARGAVPYVYSISKYETTIGQYAAFLNAVAKSESRGLYGNQLSDTDAIRGITQAGRAGNYVYHVRNLSLEYRGLGWSSANLPITNVGYLAAVRFVNWLHNGQGNGGTETGAYDISQGQVTRVSRVGGVVTFTTTEPHSLKIGDRVQLTVDGYYGGFFLVTARTETTFSYYSGQADLPEQQAPGSMVSVSAKKPGARYWIPSENEWYKAAYYDPSPEGPADDYWLYPWQGDQAASGFGNYYVVRFYTTGRINFDLPYYTYLSDVREGSSSYYGTLNQAGNVEEWTEGDASSGGPHTRGGWWGRSSTDPAFPQTHAFQRLASYFPNPTAPTPDSNGIGFRVATVANPPSGGLRNGDSIRFHPRIGHGARMIGGVFEGSAYGSSYSVLYTISQAPPNGWTEVSVNFDQFRYFRYRSPDLGQGNVAEIEFYRSGAKVTGAASGTAGSWSNQGSTFDKAFDGNVETFVDAPEPNGAYVQLDTGLGTRRGTAPGYDRLNVTNGTSGDYWPEERVPLNAPLALDGQQFAGWDGFTSILDDPKSPNTSATIPGWGIDLWLTATYKPPAPGTFVLEVADGSGDGWYPTGTSAKVSADPPGIGRRFAGWTGDIAILSNPFLATTTALIPSTNVSIAATYIGVDTIRFYPRLYHAARMVGGVFEGTNGDRVNGPYETLYTIPSEPPLAWNEVQVDLKNYKCLRYRGPANSFCNAAEIEFFRNGAPVNGLFFGTPGSWYDLGNTFNRAVDNTLYTFFDAPIATGAYVGVDARPFNGKIRFHPRLNHTARMIGGVFEGTNGDPVNGSYEIFYTISSEPPLAWNEVIVDLKDYRYLRYRGPANSFGNIAEIEFYRYGAKVNGTAFGTPGSWYDLGNTFDKALDGNLETFFDAPISTGAYVGIGTP